MEPIHLNNIPIPPPKTVLYLPTEFWTSVMIQMDEKIRIVARDFGYGKLSLTLPVYNGKLTDVIFTDEIRIKGLIDRIGEKGNVKVTYGFSKT